MRNTKQKNMRTYIASASLLVAAVWSPASLACSDSPVLAGICIMAVPSTFGDFNNQYSVADGRVLQTSQNAALFSLIGYNYGGNGISTFALPDMRGRMVVGAGTPASGSGLPAYNAGAKGGAATVTLTVNQLPAHTHGFSAANVDFSKVTATTTLGNMSASVTGSLTLKASSATGNQGNPATNYLGTTALSTNKIYADTAPTLVSLNSASIDSSGLTVGNFTGSPTTTLSGTAGVSGTTAQTGTGAPVSIMPPYLAMTYYIATSNSIYPMRN